MDPGLDFASLLGLADHVSTSKKDKKPQFLKTKFEGPKKVKKEKGKLNANVAKFLEKKEQEERTKKIQEREKLKNLQEARSDSAKNKIAKHLKVTKSSNKAVLSEAINVRDTAVTLNGRAQCDEDDYGFCSNASSAIYDKLMGKYEESPDDPMAKFSKAKAKAPVDIAMAKERVKEALRQQEAEAEAPRTRKRKSGGTRESREDESGINYTRVRDDKEKSRFDSGSNVFKSDSEKSRSQKLKEKELAIRKRKELAKHAPKPMDFTSLLQMASTVKDKPVVVTKKREAIKEFEVGDRPMTKRQKEEWMRDNEAKLRKEERSQGRIPKKEVPGRIPKLNNNSSSISNGHSLKSSSPPVKCSTPPSKSSSPAPTSSSKVRRPDPGPSLHPAVLKSMKRQEQNRKDAEPARKDGNRGRDVDRRESDRRDAERRDVERRDFERKKNGASNDRIKEEKRRLEEKQREKDDENRKLKEKIKAMEAQLAKNNKGSSDSRSSKSDGGKRSFQEVESRRFPGEKQPKKSSKDKSRKGNRIESESEYDSEMDDFIDDEDNGVDISKEIRSIFGYDKRKFRDEPDFDDRSMENNRYSSIMQEEVHSAKIGRMEDLQDMRREEDEKRRKMQKMKSKKR